MPNLDQAVKNLREFRRERDALELQLDFDEAKRSWIPEAFEALSRATEMALKAAVDAEIANEVASQLLAMEMDKEAQESLDELSSAE